MRLINETHRKFREALEELFYRLVSGALQIFLVSKRYILVVNFGKNVQKGGGGSSPIQKISLQIYAS